MRKKVIALLMTLGLTAGMLIIMALPATAGEAIEGPSLDIPVGTVVRGDVGSTHLLGTVDVADELQGLVCEVHATATNQNSVHPGNNIVVSSNGTSVTLHDVEREGFVTTMADGTIQLGDSVSATLHMGQDGVFSGGIVVTTDCMEPTTTTTTVPSSYSLAEACVEGGFVITGSATGEAFENYALSVISVTPSGATTTYYLFSGWGGNTSLLPFVDAESQLYNVDVVILEDGGGLTLIDPLDGTGPSGLTIDGMTAEECEQTSVTTTTEPPVTTTTAPETTTTEPPGTTTTLPTSQGDESEFPLMPVALLAIGVSAFGCAALVGASRKQPSS